MSEPEKKLTEEELQRAIVEETRIIIEKYRKEIIRAAYRKLRQEGKI